ncbi:MAG: hypothetical protein JXA33_11395 [Anaerolineae bacterium]|nr:hypothetical protein [Anaerolineae bacterium]
MENKGQKPTIEVKRRRPGSSTPSTQRERAEAPTRERERGTSGGTPGGPSLPGGGNLPRSPLGILLMILLLVCGLPIYLLMGGQISLNDTGNLDDYGEATQPVVVEEVRPTSTRRPTLPPPPAGDGQTWTVMLYQDADDKVLEQDIFVDLNEAERVGSSANLNIIAQIDRYQAGFMGDGNWTGTRRYHVRQDDDLNVVSSDMVMDLGEVNMASGDTLVDFATWAIDNYPADKYLLILSDHGMGWPGGWSDATATGRSGQLPLQMILGDNLYLNELDQTLEKIRAQSGIDQFEMIGMDACLMGHIEVMSALAPHARYAVFSQETEPALGWAYAAFLGDLRDNPSLDGAQLGQAIVDSYIVDDQRIVDESARADLVGRGSPLGSLFGVTSLPSAAQVARQMGQNITLTAVDLQALPELMNSLNELTVALQGANQRNVAQARSYAQSFTNIFGRDVPPAYIDLGNFAELVARSSSKSEVTSAAARLQTALRQVVVAEKHGTRVAGATGVSIYFPNSQLYASSAAGPESYTGIADRFASESLWDDFLSFHYTGETFDAQRGTVAVPPAGAALRAPAAGGIQVSAISASATEVAPGQEVRLSVDIEGENLGYVKLLVGYLDQSANSLYVADSDYLASPDTREAGGVYYPDWGVDAFTMAFNWEPIIYAIDDGVTRYPALFTPATYGASSEQAVYTVEGIYIFADSGDRRNARLYFVNGVLQQIFGFTGEDTAGAPREIVPQSGDTFTLLEKWMDLDDQGNVVQIVRQAGETLTFSDRMFTWEVLDAAAGQYVVGFIIEDLDGNSQAVFQPIIVR